MSIEYLDIMTDRVKKVGANLCEESGCHLPVIAKSHCRLHTIKFIARKLKRDNEIALEEKENKEEMRKSGRDRRRKGDRFAPPEGGIDAIFDKETELYQKFKDLTINKDKSNELNDLEYLLSFIKKDKKTGT